MKWYVAIILFLVQFVIVVIAGVIIHFFEIKNELDDSSAATKKINDFKASKSCLSDTELMNLYDAIHELKSSGLTFKKGDFGTSWDYQSSFYASMQIITGAGFGASSPKTFAGKVFVLFYSSVGVVMFVIVAFGFGQQLLEFSDTIRKRIWSTATIKDSWKVFLFRTTLVVVVGFIIFSVIFGGIFCAIDSSLNYREVLSSISIISVGHGNFIPGGRNPTMFKGWYRLLVGFWTIASLIWFAGIFSTIRRSIFEYHDKLEPPAILDENRIPSTPLSTVVNVSSGVGADKTTSLHTNYGRVRKTEVSSGHINTITVG